MRVPKVVFAASLALAVGALAGPSAVAQDSVAELLRKAKAGEQDKGFCAGAKLEKVAEDKVQARINQTLSRGDGEVRMALAITDNEGKEAVCFLFVFKPAAMKDGKKCRTAEVHACVAGAECKAKLDDSICEVKPGEWD